VAKLDLQYDILNDSPASASPVEANFNRVEQHVNQELIERGGTVSMTAQLQLVGDPLNDLDAAPKQYVDAILPIGIIMMYGGTGTPLGGRWAVCNGAELEAASNQALFDVIGRNFTLAAVPAGRFNLPNLADRVPVGVGTLTPLGATGGRRDGTVAPHTHDINHNHASFTSGGQSINHAHTIDHNHGEVDSGGESVKHYHGAQPDGDPLYHQVSISGTRLATTGSGGVLVTPTNTYWNSVGHTHKVNLPALGPTAKSGANDSGHNHAIDVPPLGVTASGAASDAIAAADVTNSNMPPYLGVPYIIRVS